MFRRTALVLTLLAAGLVVAAAGAFLVTLVREPWQTAVNVVAMRAGSRQRRRASAGLGGLSNGRPWCSRRTHCPAFEGPSLTAAHTDDVQTA